jgi:glycosyltransferase involved in cell wall biosynthesis
VRILHLARHLSSAGGVESYLNRLSQEQASRGDSVTVLGGARPDETWLRSPAQLRTVPDYHRFGASGAATREALEVVAAVAPEVVHVHEMNNYGLALAVAERYPTIKHSHVDFACAAGGRRFWARPRRSCSRIVGPACLWHYYLDRCGLGWDPRWALWSYRRSVGALRTWQRMHRLVVNSEWMRAFHLKAGLPENRIEVLHYFVPGTEGSPGAPDEGHGAEILFVGRIMPEKGLDDLVAALPRVESDCRLVVVGDGPARPGAEKLTARLNLRDRVEFVGWQEDVEPFYRRASLLAVPSLWPEPFGIVGLEAMARALPVVAYRSGGIPEWLEDGVTGVLVEPGDVSGLTAAVDRFLSDPGEARRMGEAGQARQRRLFSPEPHMERLERIYREVIDSRRNP